MGGFQQPGGSSGGDGTVTVNPTMNVDGDIAVEISGSISFYMENILISPLITGTGTYTGLDLGSGGVWFGNRLACGGLGGFGFGSYHRSGRYSSWWSFGCICLSVVIDIPRQGKCNTDCQIVGAVSECRTI